MSEAQYFLLKYPAILPNQEETGPFLLDKLLKGLRETDSSRCWHLQRRYLSARLSPGKMRLTTFSFVISLRSSVTQVHSYSKKT